MTMCDCGMISEYLVCMHGHVQPQCVKCGRTLLTEIAKCRCGCDAKVVGGWGNFHVSCCGKWCWSGPAKSSAFEAVEAWNALMAPANTPPSFTVSGSGAVPDEKPARLCSQQASEWARVFEAWGGHDIIDGLIDNDRTKQEATCAGADDAVSVILPDWRSPLVPTHAGRVSFESPVRRWLARAAWFLAGAAVLAAAWLVATGKVLP